VVDAGRNSSCDLGQARIEAVADILARGICRILAAEAAQLCLTGRKIGVTSSSSHKQPEKFLDVPAGQSVHVLTAGPHRLAN
jgi:hypothetical protein